MTIQWIQTNEEAMEHISRARREADVVFLDTETTGLDPYTMELLLISMRYRDAQGTAYTVVFDVRKMSQVTLTMFGGAILANQHVVKVFHNAVFDFKVLYHFTGYKAAPMVCTEITERLLVAGQHAVSCSLKNTAARRLKVDMSKEVRDEFVGFVGEIEAHHIEYSGTDVDVLEEIYRQQLGEIIEQNLNDVWRLEMDCLEATAMMEYHGVHINQERLASAEQPFIDLVHRADQAIQNEVLRNGLAKQIVFSRDGHNVVNTASPMQMREVFAGMGIETKSLNAKDLAEWDARWSRTESPVIDPNEYGLTDGEIDEEDQLLQLSIGYSHPFLKKHGIRTAAEKILGTYVQGLQKQINPETKKIHPSFRQCGAMATGRYSSNGPNFQNLPQLNKLTGLGMQDYDIRSMFIPDPGDVFIIADYSAIELVITACFSGDEILMHQMASGDVHSFVATSLFGIEVTADNKKYEPYSILRNEAKRTTYAILYGTSGRNLERTLGLNLSRCGIRVYSGIGDEWIHSWHGIFPAAGQFLTTNSDLAVTRGYVTTVMGRRRRWNTLFPHQRAYHAARREGSNSAIQGSSADMTKLAIRNLYRDLDPKKGRIVATIHDELLLSARDEYKDEVAQLTKYHMEEAGYSLFPNARDLNLITVTPKMSNCYDK